MVILSLDSLDLNRLGLQLVLWQLLLLLGGLNHLVLWVDFVLLDVLRGLLLADMFNAGKDVRHSHGVDFLVLFEVLDFESDLSQIFLVVQVSVLEIDRLIIKNVLAIEDFFIFYIIFIIEIEIDALVALLLFEINVDMRILSILSNTERLLLVRSIVYVFKSFLFQLKLLIILVQIKVVEEIFHFFYMF